MWEIIHDVIKDCDEMVPVNNYNGGILVEYSKCFGGDCGITVCGEYDDKEHFNVDYYFPYFRGKGITTQENLTLERHADKESYAGGCDDLRVGFTLIFYVQNTAEYLLRTGMGADYMEDQPVTLTGLALDGKILLPVLKDMEDMKVEQEITQTRSNLIAAARDGDEEAMESLTMNEMDTYSMISQRLSEEDILSIVDTYFMPYGIECDKYEILGEITAVSTFRNVLTGEEIVRLSLECNDLPFDICINREDLLGEPLPGRRFKGKVWLQGKLIFQKGA